jgi:alkylation response protein AidB-like acyl-CoA dehydrogenase
MEHSAVLHLRDRCAWLGSDSFVAQVREIARLAAKRAAGLDQDYSFPEEDIQGLAAIGALEAPLPPPFGLGLGTTPEAALPLMDVLRRIGHASLPLGRLYEGHVNALALIARFGTASQIEAAAQDAADGLVFGVWNTEGSDGLMLEQAGSGWRLNGRKIFASGAGFIGRPLVTAKTDDGALLMVLARPDQAFHGARADLSDWRAHGMRASATGNYDFSGIVVDVDDIIGHDGDYRKEPTFSAGAWRFAAVHLGGIERLLDETRCQLRDAGRVSDPHQLARMGQAAVAAETAHLWVARAAEMAEHDELARDPEQVTAYVNLARSAVERAGLDVLELVHRSIGLAAFLRANPIERVSRDLATYLRQPGPDRAIAEAAAHTLRRDTPAAELWS